jgi:uncharacterized membrane protein YuzA (DUF378 family)
MNAITYAPRAANDGLLLTPIFTVEAVLAVTNVDEYIHPGAIALGLSGLCLFIVASWLGWSFGYTAMLIAVVTGLAGVYSGCSSILDGVPQRFAGTSRIGASASLSVAGCKSLAVPSVAGTL